MILAAGRGRRMGELTESVPKAALPLGDRPVLVCLLDLLWAAGIRNAEIVTGYLADELESVVLAAKPRVALRFHRQSRLDGTAAAALLCREACAGQPFLLCLADVLGSSDDYRTLLEVHRRAECQHVLGVNRVDDPWRGAAVYLDVDGAVRRIVEKPPRGTSTTVWNNSGVLVLSSPFFHYAERVPPSGRGERELPSAIGAMLEDGVEIRSSEISSWRHVGTPPELEAALDPDED